MPSSNEYDANLLLETSAPTKGMLQSGYTTDLLEPKPLRRDDLEAARHKSVSRHISTHNKHDGVPGTKEPKVASRNSISKPSGSAPAEKPAFYRTRKGIIALVIVIIVILAAIIGGAVGGVLSHTSTDQSPTLLPPAQSGNSSTATTGQGSEGGNGGGAPPAPPEGNSTATQNSFSLPVVTP